MHSILRFHPRSRMHVCPSACIHDLFVIWWLCSFHFRVFFLQLGQTRYGAWQTATGGRKAGGTGMRRRKLPDRKMRKEERHPLVLFFNALAISSLLFRMAPISARLPCRVGATDAPLGSVHLAAWHLRVDSTRGGAADDDARADAARVRRRVLKSPPPGPAECAQQS